MGFGKSPDRLDHYSTLKALIDTNDYIRVYDKSEKVHTFNAAKRKQKD